MRVHINTPQASATEKSGSSEKASAAGQLHHFADGEETVVVRTMKLPCGQYAAVNDDGSDLAIGTGFSTIGAIADLFEKMPRAASEREERDSQAAAWDHARDLRKEFLR